METKSETTYLPPEPVTLDEETQRRLLKQVLKGTIDRAQFPQLWPDDKKIRIFIGGEELP